MGLSTSKKRKQGRPSQISLTITLLESQPNVDHTQHIVINTLSLEEVLMGKMAPPKKGRGGCPKINF